MSVADTRAQVSSSMDQANEAAATAEAAKSQLDSAIQTLAAATADTNHEKPGEAQSFWSQAQAKADELIMMIRAGNQAAEDFNASI